MPTSNPVLEIFPSIKKRNSATQTFANATQQAMVWNSTVHDNFAHDISSSVLRCKKPGIYKIGAFIRADLPANAFYYLVAIKNGNGLQTDIQQTTIFTNYKLSIDVETLLAVGDEITFGFFQNTGSAFNLTASGEGPSFWMTMVAQAP